MHASQLMKKIDVNGDTAHPLYQHLKKAKKGIFGTEGVKWNFTKVRVRLSSAAVGHRQHVLVTTVTILPPRQSPAI